MTPVTVTGVVTPLFYDRHFRNPRGRGWYPTTRPVGRSSTGIGPTMGTYAISYRRLDWRTSPLVSRDVLRYALLLYFHTPPFFNHDIRLSASPYLVSLGMTKSGMAVVFLAGPVAGLVVQPVIGLYWVARIEGCSTFSRNSCG